MKEIMAVLRVDRMNRTKKALADAGITSMTAYEALGRGKGTVDFKTLKGAEEGFQEAIDLLGAGHRLRPKRLISVVVPDKLVQKTLDTIIKVNQTGKAGDGKIFVIPTYDAVRVRTNENGDSVLDEE